VAPTDEAPASVNAAQVHFAADVGVDVQLRKARSHLAVDTAAILLFDEANRFLVAAAASGIEEEVREGSRVRAGLGFAGRIAAERSPVILEEITPLNVVNPLLLRRGIVSMLGVPLFREGGGSVLGVMHVGSLTPRRFTVDDVRVLEDLGREVSTALTRHRAFVDRTAAAALQLSLASGVPDIDGLDIASRYVAGSQYGVGGDWHDVFLLPSGLVGVAMGDVMGHGLQAATVMGRVRSVLRAYALEYDDPAVVLARLDRELQHFEPDMMCTVLYAVLDPSDGVLTLSSSGHLPPIASVLGEGVEMLTLQADPPIGVPYDAVRKSQSITLEQGGAVCLYSDGLVERRRADLDSQLALLTRVVADADESDADALCAEVMSHMLRDRVPEDDVSLLVVRWAPGAGR